MWYGIVGVSGLAFVCALELIPEINKGMKLVPFSDEFKTHMTAVMVLDYALCWLIEIVLKKGFSDFRPRDIAERRVDQLQREAERKAVEDAKKLEEEERVAQEKIAEFERKVEARKQQIENWRAGRQQGGN